MARVRGSATMWPIPAGFDSSLAGLEHYGFAHGVAGAGTFLMYASLAGQQESFLTAALQAGHTLSLAARRDGDGATWPTSPGEDSGGPNFQHWCSGASGVGTFLIRLWHITGDKRFLELADQAAVTIRRQRWCAGNSACHGLAGDGEFLLDMARFTDQGKYMEWAQEIATVIYARRRYLDGLAVACGEDATTVTADFNTGLGGIIGFLLRLRHQTPRWWMADHLLSPR
jgi:lantibiotic modifying enzyme